MNIALVTQVRSGTYMLFSALESHPEVAAMSWPGAAKEGNPWGRLKGFLRDRQTECKVVCMHQWGRAFIVERFGLDVEQFWDKIGSCFDCGIFLKRKNQLRRYISHLLMEESGRSECEQERGFDPLAVRVDISDFMESVKSNQLCLEAIVRGFRRNLKWRIEISYELLLGRWSETSEQLQGFLGLSVLPIEPNTVQQETRMLPDIIENYEEVAQACRDINHGDWLVGVGYAPAEVVDLK